MQLDHGLQQHLTLYMIMASKRILEYTQLVAPTLLTYDIQVHLQTCLITACRCNWKFSKLVSPDAPQIALEYRLQSDQPNIYIHSDFDMWYMPYSYNANIRILMKQNMLD